jgi:hypothetical protein
MPLFAKDASIHSFIQENAREGWPWFPIKAYRRLRSLKQRRA